MVNFNSRARVLGRFSGQRQTVVPVVLPCQQAHDIRSGSRIFAVDPLLDGSNYELPWERWVKPWDNGAERAIRVALPARVTADVVREIQILEGTTGITPSWMQQSNVTDGLGRITAITFRIGANSVNLLGGTVTQLLTESQTLNMSRLTRYWARLPGTPMWAELDLETFRSPFDVGNIWFRWGNSDPTWDGGAVLIDAFRWNHGGSPVQLEFTLTGTRWGAQPSIYYPHKQLSNTFDTGTNTWIIVLDSHTQQPPGNTFYSDGQMNSCHGRILFRGQSGSLDANGIRDNTIGAERAEMAVAVASEWRQRQECWGPFGVVLRSPHGTPGWTDPPFDTLDNARNAAAGEFSAAASRTGAHRHPWSTGGDTFSDIGYSRYVSAANMGVQGEQANHGYTRMISALAETAQPHELLLAVRGSHQLGGHAYWFRETSGAIVTPENHPTVGMWNMAIYDHASADFLGKPTYQHNNPLGVLKNVGNWGARDTGEGFGTSEAHFDISHPVMAAALSGDRGLRFLADWFVSPVLMNCNYTHRFMETVEERALPRFFHTILWLYYLTDRAVLRTWMETTLTRVNNQLIADDARYQGRIIRPVKINPNRGVGWVYSYDGWLPWQNTMHTPAYWGAFRLLGSQLARSLAESFARTYLIAGMNLRTDGQGNPTWPNANTPVYEPPGQTIPLQPGSNTADVMGYVAGGTRPPTEAEFNIRPCDTLQPPVNPTNRDAVCNRWGYSSRAFGGSPTLQIGYRLFGIEGNDPDLRGRANVARPTQFPRNDRQESTWLSTWLSGARNMATVTDEDWLGPYGGAPVPLTPFLHGVNIGEISDYGVQILRNKFAQSRIFWETDTSPERVRTRDTIDPSRLRPDGYPRSLPPGTYVFTYFFTTPEKRTGNWHCLWDGDGRVRFNSISEITTRDAVGGEIIHDYQLTGEGNAWSIAIERTNPANPVRNIRVVHEAHIIAGSNYRDPSSRFDPDWLDDLLQTRANCLRLMDLQAINGSAVSATTDLWPDDYQTQSNYLYDGALKLANHGPSWSLLAHLIIATQARYAWIHCPHLVPLGPSNPTNWWTNFVQYLHQRIPSTCRLILEHTNELWNGVFPQATYARGAVSNGQQGTNDQERAAQWHCLRTQLMAQDAARVLGGAYRARCLAALMWQRAANEESTRYALHLPFSSGQAPPEFDIYGVANYFGDRVGNPGEGGFTPTQLITLPHATLDAWLRADLDNNIYAPVTGNRGFRSGGIPLAVAIATEHELHFVTYEGGQHLSETPGFLWPTGSGAAENLRQFNQSPAMGALQRDNMLRTLALGGYTTHYTFGRSYNLNQGSVGYWGLYENRFDQQGLADDPKYLEFRRFGVEQLGGTGGLAGLYCTPDALNFRSTGNLTQTSAVTTDPGRNVAGILVSTSGQPWLQASLDRTQTPATLSVTVDPSGFHPTQTVTAQVTLSSPQARQVSLLVVLQPLSTTGGLFALHLSPQSLSFAPAGPYSLDVDITADAGQVVSGLMATEASPWILSTVLNQTTTPAVLTVTVDSGAFTPSRQSDVVQITGTTAIPQTLSVELQPTSGTTNPIYATPDQITFLSDQLVRQIDLTTDPGQVVSNLMATSPSPDVDLVLDQTTTPAVLTATYTGVFGPSPVHTTIEVTGDDATAIVVDVTIEASGIGELIPVLWASPSSIGLGITDELERDVVLSSSLGGLKEISGLSFAGSDAWLKVTLVGPTQTPTTMRLTINPEAFKRDRQVLGKVTISGSTTGGSEEFAITATVPVTLAQIPPEAQIDKMGATLETLRKVLLEFVDSVAIAGRKAKEILLSLARGDG